MQLSVFNLLFLTLFNNILFLNAEKYSASYFYQDNTCKDLNFVFYSYGNLEVCEVLDENICNGYGTYSNKLYCGENALENTKKEMLNNNYVYFELYDTNCTKQIGAYSIKLNKCISFMDMLYIKITEKGNTFNSTSYLDPECKDVYIPKETDSKENEKLDVNNNNCLDKIKVFTKDGEIKLPTDLPVKDKETKETENNSMKYRHDMVGIFIIIVLLIIQ